MKLQILSIYSLLFCGTIYAQTPVDTFEQLQRLNVVEVSAQGRNLKNSVATNTSLIGQKELYRAACCNLGESFTTNPSVDVSYSDAATGARQIKLLGLSGTYVQMLTENIPAARGASAPYYLGYIPGPWMQSIQVSKGASSVKNGYESVTGQINIEMLKPQLDPSLALNGYVDQMGKTELNGTGNIHLGDKWSTGLLLHGENSSGAHDSNHDNFIDLPRLKQGSIMNRWMYQGGNYLFQGAIKGLAENRRSGQLGHARHGIEHPYIIDIKTRRLEGFAKNAFFIDRENEGSIALMLSGNIHSMDANYGYRLYDVTQRELYASLLYERKWNEGLHGLSTGLSWNHDDFKREYRLDQNEQLKPFKNKNKEDVSGAYAQYTLNVNTKLIVMAGARYDYNSIYGNVFTPRLHLRWNMPKRFTLQGSIGRGHHSPHPLEEYNYILASSRTVYLPQSLKMETADNMGCGIGYSTKIGERKLSFNTEYYYTKFKNQLVADLDSDPHAVYLRCIANGSYSHAFQVEATVDIVEDMTITAAYRLTDVKINYGQGYVTKPLTSRYKGLLSIAYNPFMGLWQFDVTCSLNGSGVMPTNYISENGTESWGKNYEAYPTLNIQVTRNFRNWSVYLGGENLTGYKQKNPIIGASNPWGGNFDATMIYGPLHGALFYAGFRFNITKYID